MTSDQKVILAGTTARTLLTWPSAALLVIVILFATVRWRLADMPLERDEGEYAYAGQLMLEHIPPYKFAYNMKLPGTYAAYAAMMRLFGETPRGIHLGVLLVNAGTIVLIFFLGKRLLGDEGGLVAAAAYGLLSTHQKTLGFAGHATHFVTAAAVVGLIFLLLGIEREKLSLLFWSGTFFGLGFVMKQPGLFFGIFGFCYLLYVCLRAARFEWKITAQRCAVYVAGCALPFAFTCLVLWKAGVFQSFWLWTFSYARQYSSLVSLKDGWELFTYNFLPMFYAAWPVWIVALIGLSAFVWQPATRKSAVLLLGLLFFSCLAVSAGLYFRTHYFIMLLPATALLAGLAVTSTKNVFASKSGPAWARVPLILFFLGWGWAVARNGNFYFRMTPPEACHAVYINSPFIEAIPIADYIREHTAPTDKVAVLGSEPEIPFYAHRLSATGYIYVYALMENQPYWRQMQKQMIEEVESSRPAYLLYSNHPATWLTTMGSPRLQPFMDWAIAYVKNNYEQVGLVELADPQSTFIWGDVAKTTKSQTQFYIAIYKRRSQ